MISRACGILPTQAPIRAVKTINLVSSGPVAHSSLTLATTGTVTSGLLIRWNLCIRCKMREDSEKKASRIRALVLLRLEHSSALLDTGRRGSRKVENAAVAFCLSESSKKRVPTQLSFAWSGEFVDTSSPWSIFVTSDNSSISAAPTLMVAPPVAWPVLLFLLFFCFFFFFLFRRLP